jgi:hypothetical protein
VVERGELGLQDFKKLLLDKEQSYLNNWNECQFNCLPTAGSNLGVKRENAKYYYYNKKTRQYQTSFTISGARVTFSFHPTEEEAIKEVEYLKTLTEDELLEYKQKCLDRQRRRPRNSKNYTFDKQGDKYIVKFCINGKSKQFGRYQTEQEAIDRVNEVKLQIQIK